MALSLLALSLVVTPSIDLPASAASLIDAHCLRCHSGPTATAGLDLRQLGLTIDPPRNGATWTVVLERLVDGDMPPLDAQQPAADERAAMVAALRQALADPGPAPAMPRLRRLTRSEYDNTLRDLFGHDSRLGRDLLPEDASGGEGFDAHADTLFVPPLQLEGYWNIARTLADQAILEVADGAIATTHGYSATRIDMHRRLVIALPGAELTDDEAARRVLAPFLRRAWRRPVAAAELEPLVGLCRRVRDDGGSYVAGLRAAVAAALVSPRFLFRIDSDCDGCPIDDHALAGRLAYFLWSSMPDDELLAIADAGILSLAEVTASQVDRMLDDPRSRSLATDFATQWLEVRDLAARHHPDPRRFPAVDHALLGAMEDEVVAFFDDLVRTDGSLLDLLDARHTFVNERLARHYAMTGISGDGLRRIELRDDPRGGLLGMAAILVATSYPLRTSPVLRGRWILDKLLGAPPPPPPPGAGSLPPEDPPAGTPTLREQLLRHRAEPACASCHRRMDPLGFALERFDAVGRLRTGPADPPIDDGFEIDGVIGAGPADLRRYLGGHRDVFVRQVARQLAGFAFGRSIGAADDATLDAMCNAAAHHDYRLRAMIHALVADPTFRGVEVP